MHVLVVTVVHTPFDARVFHREIGALRAAGHTVTYAAPFSGYGAAVPPDEPGLTFVDLPRAVGRNRLHALRAARRLVRDRAAGVDVVFVPDPALPVALRGVLQDRRG